MCKQRKRGNWSRANKTKNKDGLDNETKAADQTLHQKGQTHWMREKREMTAQERKTDDCTREKD